MINSKDDSEMSRDLIKPLLDKYQVYGINFKKKQINVFQNNEYTVSYSGSQQYGQGFTDSDFYVNNAILAFSFPFLYSSKTQYTLIYINTS